jgi:hypothetical protein
MMKGHRDSRPAPGWQICPPPDRSFGAKLTFRGPSQPALRKSSMTIEFLIHAIVHQTTILIAQLATLGGGRAPLAQVANQVFLELVRELERQGVSRKVSADMFGLGLRTYRRKIQRLSESTTERGRSLWEVVLEFIRSRERTTKHDLLLRFSLDDEAQVRSVLRDLCDSQLVMTEEGGTKAHYRASTEDELLELRSVQGTEGSDDMLVALIYREQPLTIAEIAAKALTEEQLIEAPLARLVASGRVGQLISDGTKRYQVQALLIPLGSAVGWEAAVFDHFKAVVTTIVGRLSNQAASALEDQIGGSTYTIDVWPGHPLAKEVVSTLKQVRSMLSDLRKRVEHHNEGQERPQQYSRVVIYAGQNLINEESE